MGGSAHLDICSLVAAAARVGRLHRWVDLAELSARLPELCASLDLPVPELPRGLNASRKDIVHTAGEGAMLEAALSPDLELWRRLRG